MKVKVKKLKAGALLPQYKSAYAAGMDVFACLSEPVVLESGGRALIPSGLAFEIPEGFEGQVRARSGLALKKGLAVLNAPGTIDADFRGEVCILLVNLGQEAVVIEGGERIAQIVFAPVCRAELEEARELSETARGEGGFGSSGK